MEIFTTLRNIARKKGYIAEGFENEYKSFKKMGTVAMYSVSARRRVGLDAVKPDIDDLKNLLDEIKEES